MSNAWWLSWRGTALLAEADDRQRQRLIEGLRPCGVSTTGVASAAALMAALGAGTERPDVVIIDAALPDATALAVCAHLRARPGAEGHLPIVLTADDWGSAARIQALELGADEVLAKPLEPRELAARIRGLMRRSGAGGQAPAVTLGAWRLDPVLRRLSAQGRGHRSLTGGEFKLLQVLLRQPGRVLSRHELSLQVRGVEAGPLDRYVDNLVAKLRRKLDDVETAEGALIRTVRGLGYAIDLGGLPALGGLGSVGGLGAPAGPSPSPLTPG